MPISLILIFALGSLGIYGFIVGGWASESKYSLLGSMRTCAQMVSYEVSLALSVLGVVLMAHSLSLVRDRRRADRLGLVRGAAVRRASSSSSSPASPRRTAPPFDLPEADTELVGGYSHRVLGHALGPLPDGRVRERDRPLRAGGDALLRRLGRAVGAARAALVLHQAPARDLGLHLAPRDAAAPALRPADALRLEGAAPRRDAQRRDHRPLRGRSSDARSPLDSAQGLRGHLPASSSRSRSRSSTRSTSGRSTRASAAATGCTCTRTASRSASAARSAPPPARPTASASSPPRTPPTTASRPASATRGSTRST